MASKLPNVDHPSVPDLERAIEDANSNLEGREDAEFGRVDRLIQEREAGSADAFVTKEEEYAHKIARKTIVIIQTKRDHLQKFLHDRSYVLGSVFAGSGVHRRRARVPNQDFILDWALIRISQERLGENKVWLTYSLVRQLLLSPDIAMYNLSNLLISLTLLLLCFYFAFALPLLCPHFTLYRAMADIQ